MKRYRIYRYVQAMKDGNKFASFGDGKDIFLHSKEIKCEFELIKVYDKEDKKWYKREKIPLNKHIEIVARCKKDLKKKVERYKEKYEFKPIGDMISASTVYNEDGVRG